MTTITLSKPVKAYQPRLTRFLRLMVMVRSLEPRDHHLWQVMDSVAFQDTETALRMALYNERQARKLCEKITKNASND